MSEWRPIETAPDVDGLLVDLWAVTAFKEPRESHGERITDCMFIGGEWCRSNCTNCSSEEWSPINETWNGGETLVTHWMLIPEPPK